MTVGQGQRPRLEAVTGLRAADVTIGGLRLRANSPLEFYDRDIIVQLELTKWASRFHLVRLDFRPFGAHQNARRELRHLPRRIEPDVSHAHAFDENARLGLEAFRSIKIDNLPAAVPIDPPPRSVRDSFLIVGQFMNITDCADMPMPPWQGKLV